MKGGHPLEFLDATTTHHQTNQHKLRETALIPKKQRHETRQRQARLVEFDTDQFASRESSNLLSIVTDKPSDED